MAESIIGMDEECGEETLTLNDLQEKEEDSQMEVNNELTTDKPSLPPISQSKNASASISRTDIRSIFVPNNRRTPLRANWVEIRKILVETLLLDVRYNVKKSTVQIRNGIETKDPGSLQKGEDFVKAFVLGFDLKDAVALIRLDELYLDSFEVTDVKYLNGDHLSRAIGRIAGHVGKMKNALENACRTRIVIADKKVHLLGTYNSVQLCKSSISSLIMGKPSAKIFGNLRGIVARASRTI